MPGSECPSGGAGVAALLLGCGQNRKNATELFGSPGTPAPAAGGTRAKRISRAGASQAAMGGSVCMAVNGSSTVPAASQS
jgi:hypothetical protein